MKHLILAAVLLLAGATTYAQCGKKVLLTASQTEYLGSDKTVQRTEKESSVIEFDSTSIIIVPGNDDHKMTGTIRSSSCDWSTAFKEGKTVLKVDLADHNGEVKKITITIEGKNGRVEFLAEVDDMPDKKIHLVADKFEEKQL